MPERNHEVIIDDYVFPDTVTVTLSNDDFIDSRDYVSKELYESVCAANDAWQTENAKLRELVRDLYAEYGFAHARMRYIVLQHEERMREIEQRMRELGADE